mgnify:FL=1
MIVPTLFWAKLVELGPDSTSNPTVGLKALLQYKPYNKLLVLQDDVKSLLITVNITARHWFLLQVDVVNAKIIVYDSIFQDEAFYDSYFIVLEKWVYLNIVPYVDHPPTQWMRTVSQNVLEQPLSESDQSCAIYTILHIVSIVCEVRNHRLDNINKDQK